MKGGKEGVERAVPLQTNIFDTCQLEETRARNPDFYLYSDEIDMQRNDI